MKVKRLSFTGDVTCLAIAAVMALALLQLALRLKAVQVDGAAAYRYATQRQSERRVQTDGLRGRILDRRGLPLAENRVALAIVCDVARFERRTWEATVTNVLGAAERAGKVLGVASPLEAAAVRRHVRQQLALPLVVWRDVGEETLARFAEHERELAGFVCRETVERRYPLGTFAAHVLGYVGRARADAAPGDEQFHYFIPEMRGREGLESYYDGFLRGVPGENRLLVDARGYAQKEWTVVAPQRGPDLVLALDARIQHEAERQLAGACGACAVIDPRNGDVLALASAPAYDPNLARWKTHDARYRDDPRKPYLNRAAQGTYAPGSTFKPVTALAALAAGVPSGHEHECTGLYVLGGLRLHCSRRWGHGALDLRHALMQSCNPYFCDLGVDIGTNALLTAARALGLGAKAGLDLGADAAGVLPDAAWKARVYGERWYPGDVPQMAIGQGMLLATPLQMARVAGAIGTGYLVTPHLKRDLPVARTPLPFAEKDLRAVREGMRLVVTGDGETHGTGRLGGKDVAVAVSGKTGTAEVGLGARRRKNVWFIAYAPSAAPTVAIALVIENGESGGGTAAPKVAAILRTVFGGTDGAAPAEGVSGT